MVVIKGTGFRVRKILTKESKNPRLSQTGSRCYHKARIVKKGVVRREEHFRRHERPASSERRLPEITGLSPTAGDEQAGGKVNRASWTMFFGGIICKKE
jgi:hypothetical protein